jgi:hypothetical protein
MHAEYFGTTFYIEKYTALDDGRARVKYVEDGVTVLPFKCEASAEGVNFAGSLKKPLTSRAELQDFARLIADVWTEHIKLAPRITKSGVIE